VSDTRRTSWQIHPDALGALEQVEQEIQARISGATRLRDEEAAGSNPDRTSISAAQKKGVAPLLHVTVWPRLARKL